MWSEIFSFAVLSNVGRLKEKNFVQKKKNISFNSRHGFGRPVSSSKTNVAPFCTNGGK